MEAIREERRGEEGERQHSRLYAGGENKGPGGSWRNVLELPRASGLQGEALVFKVIIILS